MYHARLTFACVDLRAHSNMYSYDIYYVYVYIQRLALLLALNLSILYSYYYYYLLLLLSYIIYYTLILSLGAHIGARIVIIYITCILRLTREREYHIIIIILYICRWIRSNNDFTATISNYNTHNYIYNICYIQQMYVYTGCTNLTLVCYIYCTYNRFLTIL